MVTGVASEAILTGWSARVAGGIGADVAGKQFSFGSEVGGFGSEHLIWTLRGRISLPLH